MGMFLFIIFEIVIFLKFDYLAGWLPKRQTLAQGTRENSADLSKLTLEKTGNLNLHVWSEICARDLNILCNFPMFPNAPNVRFFLNKTEVAKNSTKKDTSLSLRLFGFIIPNQSGIYLFTVKFCRSVEVWLSYDENWRNARQIWDAGKLSQDERGFGVSDKIELITGKRYFIEVVATCILQRNKAQLLWKTPMSSDFEVINGSFLSHYMNDDSLNNFTIFDDLLPVSPICASRRNKTTYFPVKRKISYLSHDKVKDILPHCDYNPSYTVNKRLKKFHAIKLHALPSYVYPFPEHPKLGDRIRGYKHPLGKGEALEVVRIFTESLERKIPG